MPVSTTMQRYAAEIYRLQQDHPYATLSMLAEHVSASLQAVSRMIQRLKEAGLLEHEPYKGVRLTSKGVRAALPAVRRHRLVEVFLVKVMQYDWADAHEYADTFERGINQHLEDRIDEITGHPTHCPHGDPIPTKDGHMPILNDQSLTNLGPGTLGHVSRVRTHEGEKLRYLARLGIVPGVGFKVVGRAPFDGPLRVLVGQDEHVFGHELAAIIWVETLNGEISPDQCTRTGCPLPRATGFHRPPGRPPARNT